MAVLLHLFVGSLLFLPFPDPVATRGFPVTKKEQKKENYENTSASFFDPRLLPFAHLR